MINVGETRSSIQRRPLLVVLVVALGIAVALVLAARAARAASTVTLQAPAANTTSTCPIVVTGTCRYTTVRDALTTAVNSSNAVTWTAAVAGLPSTGLRIGGVSSVAADDALQSIALTGTTDGGLPVQLSAVWGTAATPQLGIAIRPAATSLSALNPRWTAPADPSLANPLVVSTASAGGTVDLAKLPATARTFYPAGFTSAQPGTGAVLFAGIDTARTSNPGLKNALTYLGIGSTATVQGTLSSSLAPVLSTTSTPADQAGLSLGISSTTSPGPGNSLPGWLTSRTVTASLSLPAGGGAPAIGFGDTLVTSIGGQPNTFAGTFGYDPNSGSRGTVSVSYAVQSGSTFRAPFGLGTLQLSDSALALSATVDASPQFSGDLTSTVTLNAHTFGIAAHLAAGSGTLAGDLTVTGPVTAADTLALGNKLLGTTVTPDAGSVGSSLTLTRAQFSFSTVAGTAKTFALTASTTFRGATADVLASIQLPVGGPAKLFFGVHAADLDPSTLVAQPSPLLDGLTFPHADLFVSKGYLVDGKATEVDWDDLLPAQQTFFHSVYGDETPDSVEFGPTLSFSGSLQLPEAVGSRFGVTEPVEFSGDLGFGLDSLGTGTAPALAGSLLATLPAMTGLPGWISGSGPWTVEIAADSQRNVQLEIDGTIEATVDDQVHEAAVTGAVSKVDGVVTFELDGSVTGTFANLFGLSWLSATDPTVSLRLVRGAGGTSLAASLRSDVTINGYALTADAVISNGRGTSATVTVNSKDSTAGVGVGDVVSFFGGAGSSPTGLPTASLNDVQARVSVTKGSGTAVTVDVVADTSVTFHSGGEPFDSKVLLSLTKPPVGATRVIAGFRADTPVSLSDFVSSPAVDFSFPSLAVVVANQATTLTYDNLLPAEQDFFEPFCGDEDSACSDRLAIASGVSIVSATDIPSSLDGVLDQLDISNDAPVLATGTLPVFGSGSLNLRVALPQIPGDGPDFYQGGRLSLDVSSTGVAFNGTMTFNVPKGSAAGTETTCASMSGVWRTPRGGSSPACYDQVPFTVSAAVQVGPSTSVTLTGGLDANYRWVAPMGQTWLSLNRATIQFGIQTTPLKLTLGFQIGATVANHDFSGSILASLGVGGPVGIYPNLEGLRIASGSGLSAQDLVDLANASGANLSLQQAKLPNVAVRNVLLSFSQVDNPALCLSKGVHIAGTLYLNPGSGARTLNSADCANENAPEQDRAALCATDTANGCMAGVDVAISAAGVRASGLIGGFTAGPLTFSGAKVDLAISPTTQHFVIAGKAKIQDFAEGSVNLLVGPTEARFRGSAALFGNGLQAYLDGSATGNFSNLSSLKNIGSFSVNAVLKSEWLNQAGVVLSGTLAQLKPVVQALSAIIVDLDSGNVLKALFEIPTAAAKLGVSLPAPFGTAFSQVSGELQKITDGLAVLGQPFQYTLDGVLNGFQMNFPGLPGAVVPATCITTWSNGSCYTTPPFDTLFGTVPGIPGVVTPAGCITTTVNGTCYSVPPIAGPRIPGICDALRSAVAGLNCSTGGLTDSLILPALRAIVKSSSGYDIGDVKLKDALGSIQTALSRGQTFSIDCASFSASVSLGSSPAAKVSLGTNINAFGTRLTPQMTWNFAPDTSNLGSGITSVIDAILKPNLNLNGSCALPADWNTNPDFPDVVGTAVSTTGGTPTGPTQPVIPPAPVMTASLTAPSINEGGTATITGTVKPAPASPQTVSVSWGNGTTTSTTTGSGGAFSSSLKFANNTPAGRPSAQYEVKATAGTLSSTAMLTVANVAPSNLTATPSTARVNEGSGVTISGSFTDPGADGATVTYTWGDGSTDTSTLAAGVRTFTSPSHVYADNNGTAAGFPVTVKVTDDDLASANSGYTQTVDNVAPTGITVTQLAAPGTTCPPAGCAMTTPEQQAVPFSVAFTDPGVRDTSTAVIDWGDGTTDTLPLGTVRRFTINHVWTDADVNNHSDRRFPIDVRVTDNTGAVGTGRVYEAVTNVAPTNLSACLFPVGTAGGAACPTTATFAEGRSVRVQGGFSDLSALDDHVVRIDWGAGWPAAERYQSLYLPIGTFTYDATRQFGGDGTFPVVVTVSDDDNASATATSTATVTQVPPTVVINRTTATTVQGVPAFLTRTGTTVGVQAAAADPGNDPLAVLWDWKDGTTTSTTYAGIAKSTPPNPHVAPQNVTDKRAHAWTGPCVYAMTVRATDGDGNIAGDQADVVVTGTDATWRGAGYWQGLAKTKPTPALLCQLQIAQRMSATFAGPSSKVTAAPVALRTAADALAVLQPSSSDERLKLRRAILTMWLDYANGAVGYSQQLDTNGDKRPDTAFSTVMATAEGVGLNPNATQAQLRAQRQLLATFIGD